MTEDEKDNRWVTGYAVLSWMDGQWQPEALGESEFSLVEESELQLKVRIAIPEQYRNGPHAPSPIETDCQVLQRMIADSGVGEVKE